MKDPLKLYTPPLNMLDSSSWVQCKLCKDYIYVPNLIYHFDTHKSEDTQ